jgi:hypothetical protein
VLPPVCDPLGNSGGRIRNFYTERLGTSQIHHRAGYLLHSMASFNASMRRRVDNDTGALNYRPHRNDSNPFQLSSRCFTLYRAVKWIVGNKCIACVEPSFVSSTSTPPLFFRSSVQLCTPHRLPVLVASAPDESA